LTSKGSADLFIYTNPGKDHGGMRDGLGDANSPTRTKILDFVNTYSRCTVTSLPGTLQGESYCSGSGVSTENTTDAGGGKNLSSIETNDWAAYKINVPSTGTYTVQYRVASLNGGGSLRLERTGGGLVYGSVSIPQTGSWQGWTTVSHSVQLSAGEQDIALVGAIGGFNVNWFSFSSGACSGAPAQPGSITGNASVNSGSTQAYSIAAVNGATSYTWTLPSGWSGGSTATSITATVGNVGGTISVVANNVCGASSSRTFAVSVGSSNIAYNKAVSVTSIQSTGYEGSKAVDANGTTRWASSPANNQNFVVDLGANYAISRIRINWEAAYARDYQVQVSTNNSTWTTIRESWGKSSPTADDYIGLTATARWVKVYCINRATSYGFSIFEFEVYGNLSSGRQQNSEIAFEVEELTNDVLYPNPTTDKVTIQIPQQYQSGKISLRTINGALLVDENVKGPIHIVDLSSQMPGLYIIQLSNTDSQKAIKVLKK
jgi:hypothetical protein